MSVERAKSVPPFVLWCTAMIPTAFDDSMSYYEALCALYKFIQDNLVEPINNNATILDQTVKDMAALKEYVDTYFDNLDVQEEINNKLDDMAEGGQLADIISLFLNSNVVMTYNTESDLIDDTDLIAGKVVRVLGKNSINDGEGALYYLNSTDGEITLTNGLFAKCMNKFDANYYDEVSIKYGEATNADGSVKASYYIATVPKQDKFGNPITLHVVDCENLKPSEYAQKYNSTLTTNASLAFIPEGSENYVDGIAIGDGEVLNNYVGTYPEEYGAYIGIKDGNIIEQYPKTTTAAAMIADGAKQAVFCFGKIVNNGVVNEDAYHLDQGTMSFALGQKADGTILLFGNDGRTLSSTGLTVREVANIMLTEGCVNVWELDGGGSISMNYHGTKVNQCVDQGRTHERTIAYLFNVVHEIKDKNVADGFSVEGEIERIKDKRLQRQFGSYDLKHSYVKVRIPAQYVVHSQDNQLTMNLSTPNEQGRIILQYDGDEHIIGAKFFAGCFARISFTLQIENHSTSERNIYVDLMNGTNQEYRLSNRLQGGEFRSISFDYVGQYIADFDKAQTIRITSNAGADDELEIVRGFGYFEIIPTNQTY